MRRRLAELTAWVALAVAGWPGTAASTEAESAAEGPDAVVVAGSGPLETQIVVETLRELPLPGGTVERRFVPTQRLEAGQEVYYTIRVTNPGKTAVQDIVVTKRIPLGVDYVRGSAAGPACDVGVSTNGGATFITGAKGSEYTHLRWTFRRPLAPGATALLRFRAVFR